MNIHLPAVTLKHTPLASESRSCTSGFKMMARLNFQVDKLLNNASSGHLSPPDIFDYLSGATDRSRCGPQTILLDNYSCVSYCKHFQVDFGTYCIRNVNDGHGFGSRSRGSLHVQSG